MLHSMVIKALVDIPVLPVDRKLYLNGAASRKERMQLAYLLDNLPEAHFRQALLPDSELPESLEDALVRFLKVESSKGPVRGAASLRASLARFPETTFEYRYLEFLLKRYKEEKRV
jgi:hypothetical protein